MRRLIGRLACWWLGHAPLLAKSSPEDVEPYIYMDKDGMTICARCARRFTVKR